MPLLPPGRWRSLFAVLAASVVAAGCAAPPALSDRDGRVQVVTTTGLLRDLVRNVGGARVNATSLVRDGGDPHSYEPSLRDVRNVVYADVAFSNYVMLEEHNVIKALDANLRRGAANVSLAEAAVKYAAEVIPLVEDVSLDAVWLGLRAAGDGAGHGADRSSEVLLSMTGARGPGNVFGYLTGSFGDTDVHFDSSDGFDAGDGYGEDTATLPADAHTHMSWAFTEPGVYELTLSASLRVDRRSRPVPMGGSTFTVAVGVPAPSGAVVLDRGHADLTVDLDRGEVYALYDPQGGGEAAQRVVPADEAVIVVPNKALAEVPAGSGFGFLGRPGDRVFQLAQAVLGKHVHGEIDPHLWQDVRNAMAYVHVIRDTLTAEDPAGAVDYRRNAEVYLDELDALDRYVRQRVSEIPEARRHLVTTHDAFGYLARAYGMSVAGFVTPNPAAEPSLADRRKLTDTIRNLAVPAVFLEPNLAGRSSTLTEVAAQLGVRVCPIHGDTFTGAVTTYVQMMRFNADSLRDCLR
ncbi:Zinc ABC transporter, periplasmic-binding protein ZnuA [Actinokineospora spheciospongiae]|uniref:Zinc ABC transporter, periplasmic-binding protein ZnuA n=1 Tax=Actinokineospora spheciospongiae TaxID=909613 RepID=W7IEV0_9PSEU|nr:anchored repeat ABC transporter, substrate-binding protein [Actinokineospora spheciospongiae]EWC59395.1 Zinc ABC transporter, periplasmic-binding protein ZnuA [Actinokineospora spheciospongiae]